MAKKQSSVIPEPKDSINLLASEIHAEKSLTTVVDNPLNWADEVNTPMQTNNP